MNKTVKETITRATTGTQVNTNKILRLFLPEKSISGVISGVPPPPPPGNSYSSDSILRGDKPPCGPPGLPPGLLIEKNKKTLKKIINCPY